MKRINIAIDGPAGSGKTSTAKQLAKLLGYTYIDTGAMYRAVALFWKRTGKELNDEILASLMDSINIKLIYKGDELMIFLNGEDVSEQIRTPDISKLSSDISAFSCVREKLVEQQKELAKNRGTVLEGRDIGTIVLPDAELKVFLTASIDERAKRRQKELLAKKIIIPYEELRKQIEERDYNDSHRSHSPLKRAEDAIEIDTSALSLESQIALIAQLAQDRI